MKIAQGVDMLNLTVDMMGQKMALHVTLIWDDKDVILVDSGMPNMYREIAQAMEGAGVPFSRLNKIIITHHDMDHIGGIPDMLANAEQNIEILAHSDEKPFIEGTEDLLIKIAKSIETLPADQQEARKTAYLNRNKFPVDTVLTDGQELPYCGGITVIHTPGHTPGHICLYIKKAKTVVTGDATVAEGGKLSGPNPIFTIDVELAVKSLKKLANYDIENVICYHGGLVSGNIQTQIAQLKA